MTAYTATVTSKMKRAAKIDAITGFGMFVGRVNLTNYNTTLAELSEITGKFRDVLVVIAGTAEGGDWLEWIDASGSFKAHVSDSVTGITEEVTTDVDVGEFDFIAIGII